MAMRYKLNLTITNYNLHSAALWHRLPLPQKTAFAVDRDIVETYVENRNRIDGFPRYLIISSLPTVLYCLLVYLLLLPSSSWPHLNSDVGLEEGEY